MNTSFIQSLIKQDFIPDVSKQSFQPGQVFHGKVSKLFPNQIAEVQVGNQKLIAQLEVPLTAGSRYWFQVQSGEGKVHLKVLSHDQPGLRHEQQQSSLPGLMKGLQIPATKDHVEVLKFFIKEQLPATKENVLTASQLIQNTPKGNEEFSALKEIMVRNLPLTKNVFSAVLSTFKNEPVHQLLQGLQTEITNGPQTKETMPLQSLLTNLTKAEGDTDQGKWGNSQWVVSQLKSLVGKMGLNYESIMLQGLREGNSAESQKLEVLKAALLRYMHEGPNTPVKEAAEKVLDRITGVQILAQESGPIGQYVMQVPLSFLNKTTDLTVQWSGRKKENGEIDSDYCRILFYLELEFLDEVIVDMQIQNRIMTIKVINDTEGIKGFASPFIDGLREDLEKHDYHLSNILFQTTEEQKVRKNKSLTNPYTQSQNYNGVDIRI